MTWTDGIFGSTGMARRIWVIILLLSGVAYVRSRAILLLRYPKDFGDDTTLYAANSVLLPFY